ncbi:hypothetical protein A2933_01640 [Candidatus Nomurabacteria bacterium RIFCSPLOWO2_01_FULL_46_18]|uniref:Uncharacterized protein n=1 Tax=Candidatus Nomurabacteria bacterium RIFCSPLOWO2_01_FULL_46_18 TaxID=1801783 RepID=A0A1F6XCV6_9BACT|nr:MAG: hypothetical protein A2933_01640 [Candidatus Nomurabacteria bacterium RIFCSPLOWO2_01_FULL_46_18]
MKTWSDRAEKKLTVYLSHRPKLYALVVGIGIVLFWRGVWHTVDNLHRYYYLGPSAAAGDFLTSPWWDGPLSLLVGIIILYFTGSLISSFIGNELILSGLRGEKRLTEKTESEVEMEVRAVSDIKDSILALEGKITDLEKKVHNHHRPS